MRLRRIALTLLDAAIITAVFHVTFRWAQPGSEPWTLTAYAAVLSAGFFQLARIEGNDWRMGTWPDLRNLLEATGAVTLAVLAIAAAWPELVGPAGVHLVVVWLAAAVILFFARATGRRLKDRLVGAVAGVASVSVAGLEQLDRRRRTAWILSLTPVSDEPRVRRQADALMRGGWNVIVAGYPGRSPLPEGWLVLELGIHGHRITRMERAVIAALLPLCRWWGRLSEWIYWTMSTYAAIHERLAAAAREHRLACDLVVANDYFTAPIANRFAHNLDGQWCLDAHEVATAQYNDRWTFRILLRPWIDALQRRLLPRAAFITTICQSIADILDRDYPLPRPALVLRSVPGYVEMPFRPCHEPIELVYHGLLTENRGLEQTLASVKSWRPGRRLLLRGHGDAAYVAHLHQLVRDYRVQDRVEIVPSVPFAEIIPAANHSDVGYFVQPSFSAQKLYTLPNKFFEYIMAGLALCVADLPEMARIVHEEQLGWLVATDDPEAIAHTVNDISRERVDEYKRRALDSARRLCWEEEAKGFVGGVESLRRPTTRRRV